MYWRRCKFRGHSLIYAMIATTAMLSLTSLAVDWGRVELAKMEMRRIADAAAAYASGGIASSSTLSRAQAVAAENLCSDTNAAVAVQAGDVVTGTWSSSNRTFTPGGTTQNAVRVT